MAIALGYAPEQGEENTAGGERSSPESVEAPSDGPLRSLPGGASLPQRPPRRREFPLPESAGKWLFCGDSLYERGRQRADSPTFARAAVRGLRQRAGTAKWRFVSTLLPEITLRDLLQQYETRIGRFAPQVVVISCGYRELSHPEAGLLEFERGFHELLARAQQSGAEVVVNTPPWQSLPGGASRVDQLIRLEGLCACAVEAEALLVDHWGHWERRSAADWQRGTGFCPSPRGFHEMARLFLSEIDETLDAKGIGTRTD